MSDRVFREYVRGKAFRLDLTMIQVEQLHYVMHNLIHLPLRASAINSGVPALKQLESKGLIKHNPRPERADILGDDWQWWKPTTAGKYVYKLCQLAGLIDEVEKLPPKDDGPWAPSFVPDYCKHCTHSWAEVTGEIYGAYAPKMLQLWRFYMCRKCNLRLQIPRNIWTEGEIDNGC